MTQLNEKIFTPEFKAQADAVVARYETRRAASLEILRLVMEAYGHITLEAEEAVASYLELTPIAIRELMTFYTLFYDKPRAKHRFHVCRTLTCSLMGAPDIVKYLEEKLGIASGSISKDGKFSLHEVECLGACEIAPMMCVDDKEFVGPLTKEKIDQIIKDLPRG